jgi:hypothetical protein
MKLILKEIKFFWYIFLIINFAEYCPKVSYKNLAFTDRMVVQCIERLVPAAILQT